MGRAARARGRYEDRIAQAIAREEAKLEALRLEKLKRQAQEDLAWDMMDEKQYELTIAKIKKSRRINNTVLAMLGMAFEYYPPFRR